MNIKRFESLRSSSMTQYNKGVPYIVRQDSISWTQHLRGHRRIFPQGEMFFCEWAVT